MPYYTKAVLKRYAATQAMPVPLAKRVRHSSPIGEETTLIKAAASKATRLQVKRPKIQYKRIAEYPIIGIVTGQTGAFTLHELGVIPEGTSDVTRDGGVIRYEFMEWHLRLTKVQNYSSLSARFVAFRWHQGLTNPTIGDIFENVSSAIAPPTTLMASYNLANAAKYKILHDQIYNLDQGNFDSGSSTILPTTKYFSGKIKLGYQVQYFDQTGTSSDDQIWVFVCSDQTVNGVAELTTSLTYTDT